jgi:hypothetical protein
MSTFFFDDEQDYQVGKEHAKAAAEAYEVSNTLLSYQPTNAIGKDEEYSYNKYIRETQGQPLPPPVIKDPTTGQDVIIGSRDFQVSLIGEDGPDEYLSVARSADRLTTVWEDASDIRYKLDQQYYTGAGGSYQPINFGIPKYTGDAGYPITDPNPGNCKPGFLKDQFGRCLSVSWFNLPFAPAGNPWVDISGNSVITNGMNPINGVCPNDMFLASNGKCYFFPSPPATAPPPPPPATASGTTSGSSNFGQAYFGRVSDNVRERPSLHGKSPWGRIYNTPPQTGSYAVNTVQVEAGDAQIDQTYVEKQYLIPGDRAILHTTVTLFNQGADYRLGVIVPDLNFKVTTPNIPVEYPGISEEIETNFLIPVGTEPGNYQGEVQLVNGAIKIDSVNFVLAVD